VQEKYFHKIKLMDKETKQVFSNKLNFVYIEMPKFDKYQDELSNKFEKWLFLLKHLPSLEKLPIKMQEKIFEKVMNIAELAQLNKKEREAYEHSLKNYRDLQNVKDTYFEEGKLEGIIEGEMKGKLETAINARKQGLPLDIIIAITQLEEAELLKIFNENGI
jgi:predicted transposase/invertase (TIGR01784 family)